MGYYSDLSASDLANLPILQGEDAAEGQYDYMVTDMPEDYCDHKIKFGEKHACEGCRKRKKVLYESCYHFYTYDGWDSMSSLYCKKCAHLDLKSKIKRYLEDKKKEREKAYHIKYKKIKKKRMNSKYAKYWHIYYFFSDEYLTANGKLEKLAKEVLKHVRANIWRARFGNHVDPWYGIESSWNKV